ncbi:MAG: DUF1636 family protein [Candidatus Competibacterales bacterium]|nr:DUF1636 family protein [Candidatus Competibacterales bacterium]
MFDPHANPPVLTVCATCTDTTEAGEAGIGGGQRLGERLRRLLAEHPVAGQVQLRQTRCLMACTQGCAATLAQSGKMQYLLGRLPADEASARELLDFADQYTDSSTGVVPNHLWPGTLALRFLGRIPPPVPDPDADWRDDGCTL